MGLKVGALLCLLGCATPRPQSATPSTDALVPKLPMPTHVATLKNGLRVYVQEDRQTPSVAVHVVYRVGSAHDPKGRGGIAHLFEHLMFEGSKHVPRGQFDTLLTRAGASFMNAHTTFDMTAYYETLPASQLELALFLESDRMGFLLEGLTQAALDSERAIVKNEYRERFETSSYSATIPALFAATFPEWHPYHRAPIGTLAELDAVTMEDLRKFFLRWYAPNNASLVIVGNVKGADAIAAAHKWFDAIPAAPAPPEIPLPPPLKPEKETHLTFEAGVVLPKLYMMWPGPAFGHTGDAELTAATSLMLWGLNGWLVKEREIAHSVNAGRLSGRYGGAVIVEILLKEGITVEKAIDDANDVVDDLSRYARYTMDEKRIREGLYREYAYRVFELDGLGLRAETLGFYDALTGGTSALPALLRSYESSNAEVAIDAYREYILRTPRVYAFVEPKKGVAPGGVLKK